MKSKIIVGISITIFCIVICWTSDIFAKKVIYVNQTADANGDGTEAKPFRTLEEARDSVRKIQPKTEPIEIIVSQGTYWREKTFELTAEDSGTTEAPIVYRAMAPRGTTLSGGILIKPFLFRRLSDQDELNRISQDMRANIRVVELNQLGVRNLQQIPKKKTMPLPIPELFVNGDRMSMARWPNSGWETIGKIIDGGSDANSGLASDAAGLKEKKNVPVGGTFQYNGSRPERWNVEKGVWLHGYWCFDWSSEVLQVSAIDKAKKTITLADQHTYGLRQGNPSPRRWMAIHLLEELDTPGEYYIDQKAGKLYFYPMDKSLPVERIVLAWQDQSIVNMTNVSQVTLRGFIIEETYNTAINISGGQNDCIDNCAIRNSRLCGISINGGLNHRIDSCLIEQTGTGGIIIQAGDRKALKPAGHVVENCLIRSFSQHLLCYANGLLLAGCGCTARHNEFYDTPHQAIALSGNDMIFEYNVIHHVCLSGDDCGALYKGRNPSMRGNIIRYNFWYDIGSPRGHGNAAIYFDDGDGGEKVIGNVFLRTGEPGNGTFGSIFSHGGHGNLAENNIFIDSKRPLGSSPWNDKRWKDYIDAPLWQTRLLKEVDITKPPYTTHYPELIGFMDGQPVEKRTNTARKNVFVNSTLEPTGNWNIDASNWKTNTDPGFVDPKNKNYNLKPDSEVFRKIPGFQPVPFSKIGRIPQEKK